jgi:hypothetical protein
MFRPMAYVLGPYFLLNMPKRGAENMRSTDGNFWQKTHVDIFCFFGVERRHGDVLTLAYFDKSGKEA